VTNKKFFSVTVTCVDSSFDPRQNRQAQVVGGRVPDGATERLSDSQGDQGSCIQWLLTIGDSGTTNTTTMT